MRSFPVTGSNRGFIINDVRKARAEDARPNALGLRSMIPGERFSPVVFARHAAGVAGTPLYPVIALVFLLFGVAVFAAFIFVHPRHECVIGPSPPTRRDAPSFLQESPDFAKGGWTA